MPTEITSLAPQTTPATTSAFSRLTDDFDTFLTLLTTQLQNQDPLEPLDTERFTEQLVQFAGVEQSIQTNQNLEALIALQTASDTSTAISLVGRTANVRSDVSVLGDTPAQWIFEAPATAQSSEIQIFDSSNRLVAEFNGQGAGRHDVIWNGETSNGQLAQAGAYRIVVNAVDANDVPVEINVLSRGQVNAVAFAEDASPLIEINGQQFALSDVDRVESVR